MVKAKKRSFFERLTGSIHMSDEDGEKHAHSPLVQANTDEEEWTTDQPEAEVEGELALDVYQTPTEIIIHTFVAGVKPEDLEINISRDMLTIRGKREESHTTKGQDFFSRELYWGSFSRTISLPQEIEPEDAEAIERHGLLTIRLPKIDKHRRSSLKVKSL
jgi:HSP20 family molecular chaperone IbpA